MSNWLNIISEFPFEKVESTRHINSLINKLNLALPMIANVAQDSKAEIELKQTIHNLDRVPDHILLKLDLIYDRVNGNKKVFIQNLLHELKHRRVLDDLKMTQEQYDAEYAIWLTSSAKNAIDAYNEHKSYLERAIDRNKLEFQQTFDLLLAEPKKRAGIYEKPKVVYKFTGKTLQQDKHQFLIQEHNKFYDLSVKQEENYIDLMRNDYIINGVNIRGYDQESIAKKLKTLSKNPAVQSFLLRYLHQNYFTQTNAQDCERIAQEENKMLSRKPVAFILKPASGGAVSCRIVYLGRELCDHTDPEVDVLKTPEGKVNVAFDTTYLIKPVKRKPHEVKLVIKQHNEVIYNKGLLKRLPNFAIPTKRRVVDYVKKNPKKIIAGVVAGLALGATALALGHIFLGIALTINLIVDAALLITAPLLIAGGIIGLHKAIFANKYSGAPKIPFPQGAFKKDFIAEFIKEEKDIKIHVESSSVLAATEAAKPLKVNRTITRPSPISAFSTKKTGFIRALSMSFSRKDVPCTKLGEQVNKRHSIAVM